MDTKVSAMVAWQFKQGMMTDTEPGLNLD